MSYFGIPPGVVYSDLYGWYRPHCPTCGACPTCGHKAWPAIGYPWWGILPPDSTELTTTTLTADSKGLTSSNVTAYANVGE